MVVTAEAPQFEEVELVESAMPVELVLLPEPNEQAENYTGHVAELVTERVSEIFMASHDIEDTRDAQEYRNQSLLVAGREMLLQKPGFLRRTRIPAPTIVEMFNGLSRRHDVIEQVVGLGQELAVSRSGTVRNRAQTVLQYAGSMFSQTAEKARFDSTHEDYAALEHGWMELAALQRQLGHEADAIQTETVQVQATAIIKPIHHLRFAVSHI